MQKYLPICLAVLALTAPGLEAQTLFTTTRGSAASGPEAHQNYDGNEILVAGLSGSALLQHHRNHAAMTTFLGDVDGNGIYDDFDAVIDALCPAPASIDPGLPGLLFSVDRTVQTLAGSIEDGDIVTILSNGQVSEVFDESLFATWTSTSTIDIDAFHWAADGRIYFSFAQDEVTSSALLTVANGGDPVLDESCVFMIAPQEQVASLLFDRSQILGFVNNAMASSLTTIVDLTGFCPDPEHPGSWLFTTGSTNSLIEGRVFSTHLGGSLAVFGGNILDSASFGFVDEEVMESLAFAVLDAPVFNLYGPDTVQAPPGFHAYEIAGATPFQRVHLVASFSLFPDPTAEPYPQAWGFPFLLVNSSDPFLYATLQSLDFSAWADGAGLARLQFDLGPLSTGLRMTFQAYDILTGRLSPAITAWN